MDVDGDMGMGVSSGRLSTGSHLPSCGRAGAEADVCALL